MKSALGKKDRWRTSDETLFNAIRSRRGSTKRWTWRHGIARHDEEKTDGAVQEYGWKESIPEREKEKKREKEGSENVEDGHKRNER